MFLKEVSYAIQACIYVIKNTDTTTKINVNKNKYFKMEFIPVMQPEFSASLHQSSVSHDPSEIFLIC